MYGAILGDIIGSHYEQNPTKTTDFQLFAPGSRFTDDSVLTVAVAEAILKSSSYGPEIQRFACRYPDAGYGGSFYRWMQQTDPEPYNSWGNGSAMRVSPVGWAFADEHEVLCQAERSARITHNHPEGIKGAQAVALAIFLARNGATKEDICSRLETSFGYNLQRTLAEIRPGYRFDVSCQGSVPEAIIAFREAESVEGAIRNAVSLGGDADTQAAIAGSIAEAWYDGVGERFKNEVDRRLPEELAAVVRRFSRRFLRCQT